MTMAKAIIVVASDILNLLTFLSIIGQVILSNL